MADTATGREPREQLILDLLQVGWDAQSTYGLTPSITFGWFNEDKSVPQMTVPLPDEGPVNGGQTGYSSMSGDGSGPSQTIAGTCTVHLWARTADVSGANASAGQNPRHWLSYALEMLHAILDENAVRPTNPRSGEQPVEYVSYGQAAPAHDTDRTKTVYHLVVPVNFGYGPT